MYFDGSTVAEIALEQTHPCSACAVRELAVCQILEREDLAAFRRNGTTRRLERDEALCWQGDAVGYVYTVTRGALRLSQLLPDGRRQVTGFAFPGDFVGVTMEDRHPATAEALIESELCQFSRARFDSFVAAHPGMERRLYAVAARELAAAHDQMVLLGRKTAAERVATFILQMAQRAGCSHQSAALVRLPMSRMDIADYLGLRIETISREMTALRNARIIRMIALHEFAIIDRPALDARAAGEG